VPNPRQPTRPLPLLEDANVGRHRQIVDRRQGNLL